MPRLRQPALILVLTLSFALAPVSATARVPQGFVGMNVDSELLSPSVNTGQQLDRMVASGVESVRVTFNWAAAQPYQSWADVPPGQASLFQNGVGNVPTSFAATDRIVGLAARRGLTILPTDIYTPSWDAASHPPGTLATPRSTAPYGNFLETLIRRYGPHGAFWRAQHGIPALPIRMWEIWNEPDITGYWPIQPFERSYVALLRAAHKAIKHADPGAKVVLAGLPNHSWDYLGAIYQTPGSRGQFDVVGVHPYTSQPQGVITILGYVRQVMNRYGDARKPILADETGWPSSLGQAPLTYDFETTEAGQATKVGALLPLLGRNRVRLGLLGFDYFTWATNEYRNASTFDFFGLFRFSSGRFLAKPAFGAFRRQALSLEVCRQKASVATRCLKSG